MNVECKEGIETCCVFLKVFVCGVMCSESFVLLLKKNQFYVGMEFCLLLRAAMQNYPTAGNRRKRPIRLNYSRKLCSMYRCIDV